MINTKHLLIGCSAAVVVAVGVLACGAYLVYRALRDPLRTSSQVPAALRQPRVLAGDGLLTKEVFSNDRRLSHVQAMMFGPAESGGPDELCAVSGYGAVLLDADGATKRYTPFDMQRVKILGMKLQAAGGRMSRFQIIDLGGNGEGSFLARDNPMGSELIGHDGKSIWMLGTAMDIRSHPSDVVGGDLYGDGKIEFAAAYGLGNKGVVLYDASLNEIWSKPEIRASHVELIDSPNGKKNIACGDYDVINILDPQGTVVKKFGARYAREFLVLAWPPNSEVQYAALHDQDSVNLYDLDGRLIFNCEVPNGQDLFRIRAAAFMVGKVPYLAIVGSTAFSENRSVFSVYGLPEHPVRNQTVHESPLYQEVLGESYESIAKLPADDSGSESVLIGGLGQILRYRPRTLPSEPPKKLKTNKN